MRGIEPELKMFYSRFLSREPERAHAATCVGGSDRAEREAERGQRERERSEPKKLRLNVSDMTGPGHCAILDTMEKTSGLPLHKTEFTSKMFLIVRLE